MRFLLGVLAKMAARFRSGQSAAKSITTVAHTGISAFVGAGLADCAFMEADLPANSVAKLRAQARSHTSRSAFFAGTLPDQV